METDLVRVSYSIHSITWAIVFIGVIIIFHRAYEKFFRDKLENMREHVGKLIDYRQANQAKNDIPRQDDIGNMYNHFIFLSRQLEEVSDPVQAEINHCAIWGAMLLFLHLFILFCIIIYSPEAGLAVWFHFYLAIFSGMICLMLSFRALVSYVRLSEKAEKIKNSVNIDRIEA